MNQNYAQKAEELMNQGKKKLNPGFLTKMMQNKEERYEEACELYNQAATNFKLATQYEQSSNAYLECVNCQIKGQLGSEQQYYIEAANMQNKTKNTAESAKLYNKACEILLQKSQLAQAAKIKRQVAEIYESELEFDLAIKYYNEAADLYNAEQDYSSNYISNLLKVADLKSQFHVDNYLKQDYNGQIIDSQPIIDSIEIYEKVAKKYLENRLTAPSSRKIFQSSAILFLLLDDYIGCQNKMDQYCDLDPTSQNTREFKFVYELKDSMEKNDKDKFQETINNYNQIIPLNKWQITVLAALKRMLEKQFDAGNLL